MAPIAAKTVARWPRRGGKYGETMKFYSLCLRGACGLGKLNHSI